ncbi:MAG TPA: signal recognition particle receptor subunit alpha [Candidatus Babeliales bacterium]|nr:signal recognition particle receptor subunit alpha [Candidatus Babeliales bacterium]
MFDFLSQKFSSLFSDLEITKKLTEQNIKDALETVEQALLEADVPYGVVQTFIISVKNDVIGQNVVGTLKPAEQLMTIVHNKIVEFLGGDDSASSFSRPSTVMVMGLQGSGKTTTIGKLAHKIKQDALKLGMVKKILVGSIDFYRPAAIDQLEVLARQADVSFYRTNSNDPVAAAKEIFSFGSNNGFDVILLDTAGRLHIDNSMLQELQEVDALVRPAYKMLVLDAMTGQESLAIAKAFDDIIGFHGATLTKMDSDTRGGAAFAFRFILKKPIVFVGEGEKVTDLNFFYPDRAAERMLGKGDIRTLLERAEEKISATEQKRAEKSLQDGSFSLQDFADQMELMNRLGSFSQLLQYIPGMGVKVSPEMVQKGEVELKKFRAIISSMTLKERLNQGIIDYSRMQRVARGAGVTVSDVANLLKRFEEMKQYVKL